jgi:hypothetical protein
MRVPDLQPGTWADWANAIATALAFTVALVLLLIGLRDRRRAVDDRLRDQARKVWLWTAWDGFPSKPGEKRVTWVSWTLDNLSADPIVDCRVALASMPTAEVAVTPPETRVVLPPAGWRVRCHHCLSSSHLRTAQGQRSSSSSPTRRPCNGDATPTGRSGCGGVLVAYGASPARRDLAPAGRFIVQLAASWPGPGRAVVEDLTWPERGPETAKGRELVGVELRHAAHDAGYGCSGSSGAALRG